MTKISYKDELYPECPIRNILSRISDKWSLLVLYTLNQGDVMRFKEIHRAIPDISQKMLTSTLRVLEEDDLVTRKVYAVVPPKVEYALTQRAHSLLPHINGLIVWAKDNMKEIFSSRALYM